jgi:hypothetical protein
VIGGGWSGLYALKYFIEEGHDAVLFERSDSIGGVWVYRKDEPGGVARNSITTSSKTYLHASDFPFEKDKPFFLHHTLVLEHLREYAEKFGLNEHVRLRRQVDRVEKVAGDLWRVTVCNLESMVDGDHHHHHDDKKHGRQVDGEVDPGHLASGDLWRADEISGMVERYHFDAVAICTGQHQNPHFPKKEEPFRRFEGPIIHSSQYKHPWANVPLDDSSDDDAKLSGSSSTDSKSGQDPKGKGKHVGKGKGKGRGGEKGDDDDDRDSGEDESDEEDGEFGKRTGTLRIRGVDLREKKVLIVGCGESATDIAVDVMNVASRVFVSSRKGVWFHDRAFGAQEPSDMIFTKHQRDWGFTHWEVRIASLIHSICISYFMYYNINIPISGPIVRWPCAYLFVICIELW